MSPRRRSFLPALLAGLDAWSCGADQPGLRLVLITLDTLRDDAVLGDSPSMPKLAERTRRGTIFDRCYSSSSCT